MRKLIMLGHDHARSLARKVAEELGKTASVVEYGTAVHEELMTYEFRCGDPYIDCLMREAWQAKRPEHRDKLIRYMNRVMTGR